MSVIRPKATISKDKQQTKETSALSNGGWREDP